MDNKQNMEETEIISKKKLQSRRGRFAKEKEVIKTGGTKDV